MTFLGEDHSVVGLVVRLLVAGTATTTLAVLSGCGGSSESSSNNVAGRARHSSAAASTRSHPFSSSVARPRVTGAPRSTSGRSRSPSAPQQRGHVSPLVPRVETAAITKLVESYHASVHADDGEKACGLLTAEAKQSITLGTHKSCGEILSRMCNRTKQEKLTSPSVRVTNVQQGSPGTPSSTAPSENTVSFSVKTSLGVDIQIQDTFQREHGAWRLDSNGSTSYATGGVRQSSLASIRNITSYCV